MLSEVRRTIEKFNMINPGDRVVIGVSGGADSVALLLNLCEYRHEKNFDIEVVHVNHLIRVDAGEDAEFVRELCLNNGVSFHLYEKDISKMAKELHISTEEAGRIYRYDVMRSSNPDRIAVGHHRDDLAETVMLNLCRGTGLHGMAGIAPVRDDIIRPLLYVSRTEIEEYLSKLCQPYRTDSTNLSDDYTRNKIRLSLLPFLNEQINEKAVDHIANLAGDMLLLKEYVDRNTEAEYLRICKREADSINIDKNGLHNLNTYIQYELLLKAIEELTPKRKDITRNHIKSILDISKKAGEKVISLPYNLEVLSTYDKIIISGKNKEPGGNSINNEATAYEEIVIDPGSNPEGLQVDLRDGRRLKARIFSADKSNNYPLSDCIKWFDYDKIEGCVKLRFRQDGDYLTVNDKLQKKSLKDYMINEKIPKSERGEKYLIADGSHVIWLIDHRISSFYKISDSTKKILEVNITSSRERDNGREN